MGPNRTTACRDGNFDLNSQLAGTVTTGGAERTPTSEMEKSNITPVNMDFERISASAIQNQRPLYWMATYTSDGGASRS